MIVRQECNSRYIEVINSSKSIFNVLIPKGGGYTDVHLSHTKSIEEILGGLSWFLTKDQIDISVEDLQANTTVWLGWLLFSFQGINLKSLCQEIFNLLYIEIVSRYKLILTDKWDPTIDNKKRLKAIHIKRAKKDERKARK